MRVLRSRRGKGSSDVSDTPAAANADGPESSSSKRHQVAGGDARASSRRASKKHRAAAAEEETDPPEHCYGEPASSSVAATFDVSGTAAAVIPVAAAGHMSSSFPASTGAAGRGKGLLDVALLIGGSGEGERSILRRSKRLKCEAVMEEEEEEGSGRDEDDGGGEEALGRREAGDDSDGERAEVHGKGGGRGARGRGRGKGNIARRVAGLRAAAAADENNDNAAAAVEEERPAAQLPSHQAAAVAARNAANPQEASRARFLEIARRRAAHFAHFQADDEEGNGGVTAAAAANRGGQQQQKWRADAAVEQAQVQNQQEREDWPGPFSTAIRLVEGRAAAAAARRQEVASTTAGNLKTAAIPLVNWSPTRKLDGGDGSIRSRQQRRVAPSLHDICAELLCANVNHVESLGCVPESMRKMIGARLCSRRMMTAQAIGLFFEGEPVEISVPDCSLIPELELTQQMAQCSTQRLEVLELGMCGRGLSDQCLTATFATGPGALSSLTLVALRGAYRLTDKGVSALLQAAPCLTSVNLSQCSLLTEGAVKAVADCLGTQLCALSLEGCAQMDGLKLLPVLLQMPCLKKLSLSGVGGVKDEVVSELAVVLGSTLEELHLADCRLLTDAAVVGVAACCLGLKVLDLDMLPLLSDMAISCLADGCRSLRVLSLKRAKLSDEAVAAFITASGSSLCEISLNSVRQAGDNTLVALAKHSRMSLEVLDMSWCRSVTDHGLGFVADSCPLLRELRLFGCTQVTRFFMDGHSNSSLEVIGFGRENITSPGHWSNSGLWQSHQSAQL
ncbi:unnamed protein product [Sphagnum jensenii]